MSSVFMSGSVQAKAFRALLFTKTTEWHHKSLNAGVTALQKLGERHFFDVEWHEDARLFEPKTLQRFDVVIFLSTTGDVLNTTQQQALQEFIRSGKGFVGIHSASDTEKNWPWFQRLVGHTFIIHPEVQTARLHTLNSTFPGLERFPEHQLWTDEWYEFSEAHVSSLNYLLAVDESSYQTQADWGHVKGEGMGEFHPVAWYHHFDGGRSFYTALGHMASTYEIAAFQSHLFGGIYWAATGKGLPPDSRAGMQ